MPAAPDQGMDYLHNKNIVHFDLKTANLLVGMRDKTPICKVRPGSRPSGPLCQ